MDATAKSYILAEEPTYLWRNENKCYPGIMHGPNDEYTIFNNYHSA
jgi:hypothetical protein